MINFVCIMFLIICITEKSIFLPSLQFHSTEQAAPQHLSTAEQDDPDAGQASLRCGKTIRI